MAEKPHFAPVPHFTQVEVKLPKPWPRRPPKDVTCDAQVKCPTPDECADKWARMVDPGGSLHIHTCTEPATETLWWGHETWLCNEHADAFAERGYARRNPRAKR